MVGTRRFVRGLIAGSLLAIAVLVTTAPASARPKMTQPPDIASPSAPYMGNSYGAWSAAWWQYVMEIPISRNPILDTTGANALQEQSGPVYFLVGLLNAPVGGNTTVTRTVTIPRGKALFFPVVNMIWDNLGFENTPPGANPIAPTNFGAALSRSYIAYETPPRNMYAVIDGYQVRNLADYRALSPVFHYALPEDNLWNIMALTDGGYYTKPCWDSPDTKFAVSDGYWLLLKPLPVGKHTLQFGESGNMNLIYNITVQ